MRERAVVAAMGRCALGAILAVTLTSEARAQGACVPEELQRRLTRCDGVDPVDVSRGRAAPASLGEAGARAPEPSGATPEPGIDLAPPMRAPGQRGARRRQRRLLLREREILERLRDRTPVGDPQRAQVLSRLEMTCSELVRQAELRAGVLEEAIFRARQRGDARRLRRSQRRQRRDREAAHEARQCAIRALAELVRDHPGAPELDRALYALAYHLERLRQHGRARQVYHRLIRDFPASAYVPQAYLAFAEHYFAEGDLDAARQFYERVLAIGPDANPVYGYARYKLAWVRFNQDDFQGALEDMVGVLEWARDHEDEPQAASLARQARRELVVPYARVGRPERALVFFRRVAAHEDEAYDMLESLASLYHDTGQWPQSVRVHHRLMADRSGDDALCRWQARVLDATIASAPKPAQVREARRLAELREAFAAGGHTEDAVATCAEDTATALVLLATAWHREAVGTDAQPGTRDARTMALTSELYALIDAHVPDLDELRLDRIDRRDRPSRARIAYFAAELLFERQLWDEAAEAYQRVLAAGPDPQLAANAAYGAVLAYDRVLGSREPPEAPDDRQLTSRELTEEERRMAETFRRFACVAPSHEEIPIVLYRWARIFYEANQFERASVLFERVAMEHADSEVATYAAALHLDSLGVLAERRGRASCLTAMSEALDPFEERYCADPGAQAAHGELCTEIHARRCAVGERRAHALAEADDHAGAGRTLVGLVREQRCPDVERLLYNAAIHFEAARLLGRAIRVRRALIEASPDHDLARRAVHLVGANYHALAIYSEAADYYERYAREGGRCDPDATSEPCPDAAEGLRHAVTFRLGLGETERAMEDARRFEQLYRRRRPRMTAEVVFAIGAIHERAEDWSRLVSHYRSFVRRYARFATPAQLAGAHVRIARGWIAQGRRDRARPSLEATIAIFERGGEEALAELELPTDEARMARVALRDAVAEARYQLAEAERERFEAVRFPTLRGGASLARVERWAERDFRPWLERKVELIQQAEAAYAAVAPLGIPRWRIAAASRLGDMYVSLVEEVRGSPVPEAIERDPELYRIYVEEGIDPAVEPFVDVAIARYEHCLHTATEVRWFDDRSRRCEQGLHRLDRARFPIAAELRGAPTYRPLDPAPPGAPELERPEPPG